MSLMQYYIANFPVWHTGKLAHHILNISMLNLLLFHEASYNLKVWIDTEHIIAK